MPSEPQTTSPKQVFRQNLHRLAAARQLTFDDLAAALAMRADKKKWLRRVWQEGLEWPDPRTHGLLSKLCEFFRVTQEDLWSPTFQVHHKHVEHDKEAWRFLIEKIVDHYSLLQHLKLRKPDLVINLLKPYAFSQIDYLADLVADDLGYRLDHVDVSGTYDVYTDLRVEREINDEIFGTPSEYVRDRAVKHPMWPEFEEERRSELREQGKTTDVDFWKAFVNLVDLLAVRILTPPEICEQFIGKYLEKKPHPAPDESDEGLLEVLNELRMHPQWAEYCHDRHDAENLIRECWRESKEKHGKGISRDGFVHFVEKNLLAPKGSDRSDSDDQSDSGDDEDEIE
jgi:hypothetical protein